MNIKDFLIDNYIWILVIILITIITIIGFLADKKRGGKKGKKELEQSQNVNNQPLNNQMETNQNPIQYQQPEQIPNNQLNNNVGMNFNNMNTTVTPLNQINNIPLQGQQPTTSDPTMINPMNNPNNPTNNTINPINNAIQNEKTEQIYQPLSEQKPVLPPQPVPNFSNNIQQTTNTEQNQAITMPNNLGTNTIPTFSTIPTSTQPIQAQPTQIISESTLNYANPQMTAIVNNSSGTVPNFVPNNTTIPTPINPTPIPEPKSVIPQPIVQENYSQTSMMQSNLEMQTNQQQTNIPQQGQTVTPPSINFVYGPQNNNQNM